jgi:hypothetical protein
MKYTFSFDIEWTEEELEAARCAGAEPNDPSYPHHMWIDEVVHTLCRNDLYDALYDHVVDVWRSCRSPLHRLAREGE